MDKLNFNHPGGFPLEIQTLEKMQEAWSSLGLLAEGFGENVILSGCKPHLLGLAWLGSFYVTSGIMVINGEVVPFKGGNFNIEDRTNVKIEETTETITLKDGSNVEFYKKRTAVLSNGGEGVLWSGLKRLPTVKDITTRLETIEHDTGWHKCELGQLAFGDSKIQCRQKSGVVYITGTAEIEPRGYPIIIFTLPEGIQPPSTDLYFNVFWQDNETFSVLNIEKDSRSVTAGFGMQKGHITINYSYPI